MSQSSYPNVTRFVNNHMRRDSFKRLINNDPFMKVDCPLIDVAMKMQKN